MKKKLLILLLLIFLFAGCSFKTLTSQKIDDDVGARTTSLWKTVADLLQPGKPSVDVAIPGSTGGVATNTASLYCDVSEDTCYMQNASIDNISIGIITNPIIQSPVLIPSADGGATTTLTTENSGDFSIDTNSTLNAMYITDAGFFGIGTSTPISALEIVRDSGQDFFSIGSTTNSQTFGNIFNITSSGNVGIGINNPSNLLHLFGTEPQFRFGIDASNFGTIGIGNDGIVNFIASSSYSFDKVVAGIEPTASNHLATKEYVDTIIGNELEFFFTDVASGVSTYFTMQDEETGLSESTDVASGLTGGDNQLVTSFILASTTISFSEIEAGLTEFHFHAAKTNGTRDLFMYATLVIRENDGTESVLLTSELTSLITTKIAIDIHAATTSEVDLAVGDSLVVKFYANVGGSGSNIDVTFYKEGANDSHVALPVSSSAFNSIYLRQAGNTPLFGNWAIGSFELTGASLYSGTDLSVNSSTLGTVHSGVWGVSNESIFATASGTAWNAFLNTPSTIITADTLISWTGNSLNVDNDLANYDNTTSDFFDTAGRSLTGSDNTINADAEIYTEFFTWNDKAVAVATNTTPEGVKYFGQAATVTIGECACDTASTTLQFDERTTPYIAGTDILNSALVCDEVASTTSFANASIGAGHYVGIEVLTLTGSPNQCEYTLKYTYDD